MKRQKNYSTPAVEIVEVAIERGIAQSGFGDPGETPPVISDPDDNIDF